MADQDVACLLYNLDAVVFYSRAEVQKEWLEERYRAKVGKGCSEGTRRRQVEGGICASEYANSCM